MELSRGSQNGAVILVYHRVLLNASAAQLAQLKDHLFYTQEQLRAHFDHIVKHFTPITMDRLATGDYGENSIAITFDDGAYTDLIALDILREYNLPATFYLTSSRRSATPTEKEAEALKAYAGGQLAEQPELGKELVKPMAWETLQSFAKDPLVTIGSHGHGHLRLPELKRQEIEDDIETNLRQIRTRLGLGARHFAYPFGAHNAESEEAVARAGFETAVGAAPGWSMPSTSRYRLRRCRPEYMFFGKERHGYLLTGGGKGPNPKCAICGGSKFKQRTPGNNRSARCKTCNATPRHRSMQKAIFAIAPLFPGEIRLIQFGNNPTIAFNGAAVSRVEALNGPAEYAQQTGPYDVAVASNSFSAGDMEAARFNDMKRFLSDDGVAVFAAEDQSNERSRRLLQTEDGLVFSARSLDLVEFASNTLFFVTRSRARGREVSSALSASGEFSI